MPSAAALPLRVVIGWQLSTFFGWGVYGLNLALHWADGRKVRAVSTHRLSRREIAVDPLRLRALGRTGSESEALRAQLMAAPDRRVTADAVVLAALGHDFTAEREPGAAELQGRPSVGVTFFETTRLTPAALEHARRYPLIVAGSTWNAQLMRAQGLSAVETVLQGVDPTLFHPAARSGRFADRFLVFSGGKLEFRKGQDLVLKAFARFARTRPDALLVAAWHSPWPDLARDLARRGLMPEPTFRADGSLDAPALAAACGIPPRQFVDLGAIPNPQLPPVLREMDVALFPNRAEGGTNLVAMECMACGVPTILSANTGHLDLADDDACFPLMRQAPLEDEGVAVGGVQGWGESDVDEIVAALERAYADRAEARRRGRAGAAKMAGLSWAHTADRMAEILRELSPA